MSSWNLYPPTGAVSDEARDRWLADPPPWRDPGEPWASRDDRAELGPPEWPAATRTRANQYVTTGGETEVQRVNMALLLRRPLLVRGPPGVGKSALAGRIALALGLGPPLRWEINSRTTLQDGLYSYDAVGHLRESGASIDRFVRLGPLGTALLPTAAPRVLLVDELDKSSYDLPNDLLHAFEEGAFVIPELARDVREARVGTWDAPNTKVKILDGRVRTHHHPVVVVTSNDEREFPPAFLRRVVELVLERPKDPAVLRKLLAGWLGGESGLQEVLEGFPEDATDVLLQALYLRARHDAPVDALRDGLSRQKDDRAG